MKNYLEKFCKLNEEEKVLAAFGVACLSCVLCFFVVIIPLWQNVQANKQKLSASEKMVAVYKNFAKTTDYAGQSKTQAELLANLQKRLPQSLNVAEQVPQYHAWAKASGVQLNNIKLSQRNQHKEKFVPVQINMSGDYSNILKFLDRLEHEGSFVVLEKVAFKGEADGKVEVSVQINIHLAKG